jgi:hypothetical protein
MVVHFYLDLCFPPEVNIYSSVCREKELLLVPYVADQALGVMQWPPFLLASKVSLCFFLI